MLWKADATAANWTFLSGTASFEKATEPVFIDDEASFSGGSAGSVSSSCHGQADFVDPLDAMEYNASRNLGRNWRACEQG